jgi:hypothetical protein
MTANRVDHFGHGQGGNAQAQAAGAFPLQASAWQGPGGADPTIDPVEAYFECITTCSLDDGECVTTCTEILRQHS